MIEDIGDFFGQGLGEADELKDLVIQAILHYERNRPRSLQKTIGPSEAGNPCARRLAMQMNEEDQINPDGDPLPSMIGTAMHAVMDPVMQEQNRLLEADGKPKRWLTEHRIEWPIPGTSDLFDLHKGRVIDWKFPGASRFRHYKANGASLVYKRQLKIYGLGMENAGFQVNSTALVFIPRSGRLMDTFVELADYDHDEAMEVWKRFDNIRKVNEALDTKNHPERYRHIPAVASDDCMFCPFWTPNPQGNTECCGNLGDPNS